MVAHRSAAPVLVTGGTGFLAQHVIVRLLEQGHPVRTTVRALDRAGEVCDAVRRAGQDPSGIDVVPADLGQDDAWAAATDGARFVLHIASPFPSGVPRDPDEIIRPARDGALRVLRAARDAGADRVVLTSSFAAVGYGHPPTDRAFTEADWSNTESDLAPYIRSKTLAERAAWDFMAREGGELELAVVNPVGIFGPALTRDLSSSVGLARQLISAMPAVPRLVTTVVDVRDAAELHLLAMTHPRAAGQRFLASAGEPLTFQELARELRVALGCTGRRARPPVLTDLLVRLQARRNAGLAAMVPELGKVRRVDSSRARTTLGWEPRPTATTLADTAIALRDLGLVGPAA